jgi:hypothetical protein
MHSSSRIDTHFGVHGTHFTEKPHNLFSRAIDTDGLEQEMVQYLEIDPCDRRISAWGERVDECLERLLGNHDLIHCGI